jgi:hypothetical protein
MGLAASLNAFGSGLKPRFLCAFTILAHRAAPCPLSDRACQRISLLMGPMLIH